MLSLHLIYSGCPRSLEITGMTCLTYNSSNSFCLERVDNKSSCGSSLFNFFCYIHGPLNQNLREQCTLKLSKDISTVYKNKG